MNRISLYKQILISLKNSVKVIFCYRLCSGRHIGVCRHQKPVGVVDVVRMFFNPSCQKKNKSLLVVYCDKVCGYLVYDCVPAYRIKLRVLKQCGQFRLSTADFSLIFNGLGIFAAARENQERKKENKRNIYKEFYSLFHFLNLSRSLVIGKTGCNGVFYKTERQSLPVFFLED